MSPAEMTYATLWCVTVVIYACGLSAVRPPPALWVAVVHCCNISLFLYYSWFYCRSDNLSTRSYFGPALLAARRTPPARAAAANVSRAPLRGQLVDQLITLRACC